MSPNRYIMKVCFIINLMTFILYHKYLYCSLFYNTIQQPKFSETNGADINFIT
jgi:hypothetical protein